MHPVAIVLLILVLINSLLSMYLVDLARKGVVSLYHIHLVVFSFLLVVMYLLTRIPTQFVTKLCFGMFGGLVLVSCINLKTNGSQKSQDDLKIWAGNAALLLFGTGVATLTIHVPNAVNEFMWLLVFFITIFYEMYLKPS